MCVLLLFPFQHEEKSIDQKSSLLPFMLFTCCRSSHGACLPLTWSGWSREGGNWTRASSPPQGFWPLTLLSFATTCSDGTADSFWRNLALWPAGVGNCWVLGACVWGQREQHGAGSIPLLWGHWHFAELCSVLQAMLWHPVPGGEAHRVPSGAVCVCSTSEFLLLCSVLAVVSCIVQ